MFNVDEDNLMYLMNYIVNHDLCRFKVLNIINFDRLMFKTLLQIKTAKDYCYYQSELYFLIGLESVGFENDEFDQEGDTAFDLDPNLKIDYMVIERFPYMPYFCLYPDDENTQIDYPPHDDILEKECSNFAYGYYSNVMDEDYFGLYETIANNIDLILATDEKANNIFKQLKNECNENDFDKMFWYAFADYIQELVTQEIDEDKLKERAKEFAELKKQEQEHQKETRYYPFIEYVKQAMKRDALREFDLLRLKEILLTNFHGYFDLNEEEKTEVLELIIKIEKNNMR